jgi:hypothetical protein
MAQWPMGFDPVGNRPPANSTLPGIWPGLFSFNADETYDAMKTR